MSNITKSSSPRRLVYYHVAAMNHWREVLVEQLGVLWRFGYRGKVKVGLLAREYEEGFVWRCFQHFTGLELELVHQSDKLDQFEFPTLLALEKDCREGHCDEVVYFHTKGVSQPGNWVTGQWRWLMNADTVARAGDPMLLETCDFTGSSYCHYAPHYPHFAGNFWAAKASFIRTLQPLKAFAAGFRDDPHRLSWMEYRHAAELWVGTGGNSPVVKGLREPNLTLHDHHYYASRSDLQDELMRINLPLV